jgi:parvulin-like peptidyl-prolyl isomerase
VFETSTGFYAIELISSEPEGVLPLTDATVPIRSTLLFDKKMERAATEAQDVASRVRSGGVLGNIAADLELELRTAGPFTRAEFVPGVGRQNAAIGAAFGILPGQVSDAVSTPANAYVIEVLGRVEADSTAWLTQIPIQRQVAVLTRQQVRLQEWIEALRGAADIVDRRDIVLAPLDDDLALQMPMGF